MEGYPLSNRWKNYCIYKVPAHIKAQNPKAYTPQLVSIGPYHHGEPHLLAMEEHKARALERFLERTGKTYKAYYEALKDKYEVMVNSYQLLSEEWKGDRGDRLVQLMVLDGAFLYEFMRGFTDGWDYEERDPVFGHRALLNIGPYIFPDILMLENQLPLTVLGRLIAVANGQPNQTLHQGQYDEEVYNLVFKFFSATPPSNMPQIRLGLHVLDVRRKVITREFEQMANNAQYEPSFAVKSALELGEARVKFEKSEIPGSRGVSFDNGILKLPPVTFDTTTEPLFLNAIAFECLHPDANHEVSSYIAFMQGLIASPNDANYLMSFNLIQSSIGDHQAIAAVMKSISMNVLFDPFSDLCKVRNSLNKYYDRHMRERERDDWNNYCIYKIPSHIKAHNPQAYTPRFVSIGPYHHGEPHLSDMEEHKARALHRFLVRTGKPYNAYYKALTENYEVMVNSYQSLSEEWRGDRVDGFVRLMVLDGAFLYEFMRGFADGWDYEERDPFRHKPDPIFGLRALLHAYPYILPDILMLENQLPLTVLERLIAVGEGQPNQRYDQEVFNLVFKFFSASPPSNYMPQTRLGLHVLDVSRKVITGELEQMANDAQCEPSIAVRSTLELRRAGVKFEKSEIHGSRAVSFDNGILKLPPITFDAFTVPLFLNAIVFESLHRDAKHEVSSYIAFMQGLITSPNDASHLMSLNLIHSSIGDHYVVAAVMKSISKIAIFDPLSNFCHVRDSLNKYYDGKMGEWDRQFQEWDRRLGEWTTDLHQNYLKNPWKITGVIGATIILILTFLQTIYTMKGYFGEKY